MKKQAEKLNNKGFSLVELIVVILIMGILTGGLAVSFSTVMNARSDSAAKRLVSSLNQARTEATNKQDAEIKLMVEFGADGNVYANIYEKKSGAAGFTKTFEDKLGNNHLNIYTLSEGVDAEGNPAPVSGTPVSAGDESNPATNISISFNRSSGAINEGFTDIIIDGNNQTDIILIKETGRAFIE